MSKKKWLAVYTKPRWEKKVHGLLEESGVESYCPLNIIPRKWTDRVKKIEEPLFKSYVFVRVEDKKQYEVRETPGVVNFVYWLGKPAVIRDEEIEAIRLFLGEYQFVIAEQLKEPIVPGCRLRVKGGLFMNKEATALRVHNKTVEILIESIGFRLIAVLEKSILERILMP